MQLIWVNYFWVYMRFICSLVTPLCRIHKSWARHTGMRRVLALANDSLEKNLNYVGGRQKSFMVPKSGRIFRKRLHGKMVLNWLETRWSVKKHFFLTVLLPVLSGAGVAWTAWNGTYPRFWALGCELYRSAVFSWTCAPSLFGDGKGFSQQWAQQTQTVLHSLRKTAVLRLLWLGGALSSLRK